MWIDSLTFGSLPHDIVGYEVVFTGDEPDSNYQIAEVVGRIKDHGQHRPVLLRGTFPSERVMLMLARALRDDSYKLAVGAPADSFPAWIDRSKGDYEIVEVGSEPWLVRAVDELWWDATGSEPALPPNMPACQLYISAKPSVALKAIKQSASTWNYAYKASSYVKEDLLK